MKPLRERIQPKHNWVLVEKIKRDTILALPAKADAGSTGLVRVVAVGPGKYTHTGEVVPPPFKVGDCVFPVGAPPVGAKSWEEDGLGLIDADFLACVVEEDTPVPSVSA